MPCAQSRARFVAHRNSSSSSISPRTNHAASMASPMNANTSPSYALTTSVSLEKYSASTSRKHAAHRAEASRLRRLPYIDDRMWLKDAVANAYSRTAPLLTFTKSFISTKSKAARTRRREMERHPSAACDESHFAAFGTNVSKRARSCDTRIVSRQ